MKNMNIKKFLKFNQSIKMKNPVVSSTLSKIKKLLSFPGLIGESSRRPCEGVELYIGTGFPFSRETRDSLVKPENDTEKPCGKQQGIIKLKPYKLNKLSKQGKLFIFFFLFFAISSLLLALPSEAKVTGPCSNCHTMHNSQGGQPMTFNLSLTPEPCLLRGNCIGCHGQNPGGSQNIIPLGNIPQVLHASTTDLAGGNFAYITGNKTRGTGTDSNTAGHNVIDIGTNETILTSPPGDQHGTGITNNNFTCSGANGCHGDRTVSDKLLSLKGAHHTDDSVLKFGSINIDAQGVSTALSYRFLKGVKGGEDTNWQATFGPTDHNEYFGDTIMGTSSATAPANNTISGLCAECHGYYHGTTNSEVGSASPWYRHPTDISLPSSGEYIAYTTYNLIAPVARTSGWSGWSGGGSASSTVTPSDATDDIVMCLSCHRSHASPYFKMMRWDYKGWPGSGDTNGCNVCHTSKN